MPNDDNGFPLPPIETQWTQLPFRIGEIKDDAEKVIEDFEAKIHAKPGGGVVKTMLTNLPNYALAISISRLCDDFLRMITHIPTNMPVLEQCSRFVQSAGTTMSDLQAISLAYLGNDKNHVRSMGDMLVELTSTSKLALLIARICISTIQTIDERDKSKTNKDNKVVDNNKQDASLN